MSIKKDWMERQIEAIGNTFAAILFGKDKVKAILDVDEEENSATEMEDDILDRMVKKHLSDKNFNEAENLIFNALEKQKTARQTAPPKGFCLPSTLLRNRFSRKAEKRKRARRPADRRAADLSGKARRLRRQRAD